jgi:folate-dependent phosphoribosylglycinamide formyltransferase PurN
MAGSERLRVAWLTTGRGPGSFGALAYLFEAIDRGLPVEVAVVFVNRERGEAEPTDRLIAMVEQRGVPVELLSSVQFRKALGGRIGRPGEPLQPWRYAFDAEVAARLGRYAFDLGVMFGYMLIATEELYGRYTFLNDHPALPDGPVGTYQEVIVELIRSGAAESGCMMNVVTGDIDRGPAVSYCRYAIRDAANARLWEDLPPERARAMPLEAVMGTALYEDIRARGVARERPFLVETLRAIAGGRLEIPPPRPLDLTDAVEAALAASGRAVY